MNTEVEATSLPELGLLGSVVAGKYRVERLIGRGGMGAVFQATNLTIGKKVALKFLNREASRDRSAAERFQREALAASVVESTHIVQIFDSGSSEEGVPFLVMELLKGEDLRARLQRERRVSVEVAAAVGVQVLRALVRAHAAGIVHRDLKPDNVFLCERDDGALFAKIVDFGISKLAGGIALDTLTGRGTVLGTAYYTSPEQAQALADLDGRTDLFSVGAILYECLAGRPPHLGPTYESVLIAICTKQADDVRTSAPDVPAALAEVIHTALAREREQRFPDAQTMLDALSRAVPTALNPYPDRQSSGAHPSSFSGGNGLRRSASELSHSEEQVRKRRARTLALAALAVVSGFAVAAVWLGTRQSPSPVPSNDSMLSVSAISAASVSPRLPGALPEVPANSGDWRPTRPAGASPPVSPSAVVSAAPVVSAGVAGPLNRTIAGGRRGNHPDAHQKAKSGVAEGLQLSTQEP